MQGVTKAPLPAALLWTVMLLAANQLLMMTTTPPFLKRMPTPSLRLRLTLWTTLRFASMLWAVRRAPTQRYAWSSCSRRRRCERQRMLRLQPLLMSTKAGAMRWESHLAASTDSACLVALAVPILVMLRARQTDRVLVLILAAVARLLADLQVSTQAEELPLLRRLGLVVVARHLAVAAGPVTPTPRICKYLGD